MTVDGEYKNELREGVIEWHDGFMPDDMSVKLHLVSAMHMARMK